MTYLVVHVAGPLRRLMNQKGFTDADLAENAGISPSSVWRYTSPSEEQRRIPPLDVAVFMADALGVEVTDLYELKEVSD